MKTFLLCLFIILLQSSLVRSASDVSQEDDCTCNEESANGQYCKKWVCKVEQKCFPGFSLVTVQNDNQEMVVPVSKLKVGDCVVDSFLPRTCSRVNAISYRQRDAESYFARIISGNVTTFATFEHLIPTFEEWNNIVNSDNMVFKQVKDLEIGDIIVTKYGQYPVDEIQFNKTRGVYSPHTDSGLIIVDDVLFSTYSSVSYHGVAHWFFSWYNSYRNQPSENDDITPSELESFLTKIALKIF